MTLWRNAFPCHLPLRTCYFPCQSPVTKNSNNLVLTLTQLQPAVPTLRPSEQNRHSDGLTDGYRRQPGAGQGCHGLAGISGVATK